jgi:hypothetical protein
MNGALTERLIRFQHPEKVLAGQQALTIAMVDTLTDQP